jgi:hypothetical protein
VNTFELRKILIEDLQKLRSGEITANEARARASLAKQIIETAKLELIAHVMDTTTIKPLELEHDRPNIEVSQIEMDRPEALPETEQHNQNID